MRYAAALLLTAAIWPAAQAADYVVGNIVVTDPWASPTPPMASVGAVYFTLSNKGMRGDRLIEISTPIARTAEIHVTQTVRGNIEMRSLESLEFAAGSVVKVEPGAVHIMLLGLTRPLAEGETFPVSLRFRDAGKLLVEVAVRSGE